MPSSAWSFAWSFVRSSGRYYRQLAARYHLAIHPDRAADIGHSADFGHLFGFNAQFLPRRHRLEKLESVYGPEQRHSLSSNCFSPPSSVRFISCLLASAVRQAADKPDGGVGGEAVA